MAERRDGRMMTVMSFAKAMKLSQSDLSLASSVNDGMSADFQHTSIPPVQRIPSAYGQPVHSRDDVRNTSSGRPSVASWEFSKVSIQRHQTPDTAEGYDLASGAGRYTRNELRTFTPPPALTRLTFPGGVSEGQYDDQTSELDDASVAAWPTSTPKASDERAKDPYHRTIHDAYPHVFKPMPQATRTETNRTSEKLDGVFSGLRKKVKGCAAHRNRTNARKLMLGLSAPVEGSFRDFDPRTRGHGNVLHAGLKAIAIEEARKRFVGRPELSPGFQQPPQRRKVKVVGHASRDTVFRDFMDSKIFDSSSEESVEAPPTRLPTRRNGLNRGSSKPLPPLPDEARLEGHTAYGPWPSDTDSSRPVSLRRTIPDRQSYRRPSPYAGPCADTANPEPCLPPVPQDSEIGVALSHPRPHKPVDFSQITPSDLFADVTEEETSRARRQAYLESSRAGKMPGRQPEPRNATDRTAISQWFDEIDRIVANDEEIPDHGKQWANGELHRMDDLLARERRVSDGSIIIDTFPHDAHTSWRATERSDDYTIHSDYRRFSREVHGTAGEQDAAGMLMERLSREMQGR